MSLHIEISGESTARDWEAIAAVAAIMLGTTALTPAVTQPKPAPAKAPTPPAAELAAELAKVPPPPAPEPVAGTPAALADALMASESERVAAVSGPTPLPPPPAGVELDVKGLPWDLRIHAATKTKNKDGSWRTQRGVDPALVAAVETELRSVMAAPLPPVDATAAFGAPPPPPADVAVPAPPAEALPDIGEFARIMRVIIAKQAAGSISTEMTGQIARQLGLPDIKSLATRPDLIPAFEALLP